MTVGRAAEKMQKTSSSFGEPNDERSSLFRGASKRSSKVYHELKKRLTLMGSHFELVSSGEVRVLIRWRNLGAEELREM